ncbi:ATP11-domain-containing protein, partial [Punctularia strigosozonata HHB-11173 SS5]|uniref:ATP11-domain-containing protein n=1 Tax=Punctularia strigosozonata (strain HHB-11173) TaxID=741275 RepID=UPI0004417695
GLSVEQLRAKLREEELAKRRQAATSAGPSAQAISNGKSSSTSTAGASIAGSSPLSQPRARKDSSPVKPLSQLFNLPKLLSTPHTPAQIQALWTAYHASRSSGTGRGFLCATVPAPTYEQMLTRARRYPSFILPLPRTTTDPQQRPDGGDQAHEFFYMQWAFHGAPATPTYESETALFPVSSSASGGEAANPHTSTVLFTPLGEYKLRQTFATPHLVLTFYPDLARSHGVVLLRGEITPSAASAGEGAGAGDVRYLLGQEDAQMLAMGVQKFYLWGEQQGETVEGRRKAEELLRVFHEEPEKFQWEELLAEAKLTP